jgi:hypothetical protein
MAARVAQKLGAEANPKCYILMHAMGPNVAGVIGTAVAAGIFIALAGRAAPAPDKPAPAHAAPAPSRAPH